MVQQLTALFERLVAELPPATATLTTYRVPKGDGIVIELRPTNPSAASFGVHVDDGCDLVDFSFGAISTWELPMEGRYPNPTKHELLAEVEQMCRAVVAGNCEESRGLFWLTGRIHVGDYTYRVTNLPMFPLPPFGTRRYAPHVTR